MQGQDIIGFDVGVVGVFFRVPEYAAQALVRMRGYHDEFLGLHVADIDLREVCPPNRIFPALAIAAADNRVDATVCHQPADAVSPAF